ncbi:class I SAM-dependent methyltransferase [Knoellia aerolata]|uniref:class I SAM-dependent methyltransferase n=1 Tax=Knoellia aerolata TaxID=442954 RepID=UPI00055A2D5B|nr:class I SAM-dependent methyltransferase [Knoellia aerolata]
MTFDVASAAYDRFMGRYSAPLATEFAGWAGVRRGDRVLDVGCGPGALTGVLVERAGAAHVVAVDPSAPFVDACRSRFPLVEVHRVPAEQLPFADGIFDHALAQLVVHFMQDPVTGLAEMARVTRRHGQVAACVWDLAGDRSPLSPFWSAARRLDPRVVDESERAGAREGHLAELALEAGLLEVEAAELSVTVAHPDFEEWWEPYTFGVGPAGDHVAALDPAGREELREECRLCFPDGPFEVTAVAWAVRGRT